MNMHRPFETMSVPRLYVMGNNDDGQLGLGDTQQRISAHLVMGLLETPRYNVLTLDASFAQTALIRVCPHRSFENIEVALCQPKSSAYRCRESI